MSGRFQLSLDVSAVPPSPAGAGRYIVELASTLAHRRDIELVLVSRRNDSARWVPLTTTGAVRVWPAAPDHRPLRLAWEQARLPELLRALSPAVHHGPHYTMPERSPVPAVVTIHDCTFFDHPEWHERSKALFFRRAMRTAAHSAAAVVCPSQTTAENVSRFCDVRAEIFVAPHGVDHERFTPDEPAEGSDDAALRQLGIEPGRRYVLFVGTIEPRKNVEGLVQAFDAVASGRPDIWLVVAGQKGWGTGAVDRALATMVNGERVVRTGYVANDAVPALLRRATVVAYPSWEEGYGLPALEALACGAQLVTTTGTAMAEFARGAAMLVPPGDIVALGEALVSVVDGEDPLDAVARRTRGFERAAERTWEASTDVHFAAYRHAAAAGPTGT